MRVWRKMSVWSACPSFIILEEQSYNCDYLAPWVQNHYEVLYEAVEQWWTPLLQGQRETGYPPGSNKASLRFSFKIHSSQRVPSGQDAMFLVNIIHIYLIVVIFVLKTPFCAPLYSFFYPLSSLLCFLVHTDYGWICVGMFRLSCVWNRPLIHLFTLSICNMHICNRHLKGFSFLVKTYSIHNVTQPRTVLLEIQNRVLVAANVAWSS